MLQFQVNVQYRMYVGAVTTDVIQSVDISLNADYTMDMKPFFITMITFFIVIMVFTGQHTHTGPYLLYEQRV